ncbi:hypothetical protein CDES_10770 [Corynebacterium deserti GIMN1.010]|uniref:Uncharacterized protein n=1 Tax=Corynebacterium deserti GIMN1.010 TaxID=931089 RepID=A0A0M3Q9Y0_9CORY|nr:hypothetical protein [Corynebacterium deserti]ALC06529.1 hypothetical protein CDES_10770 [Corynebacterium deserti GIMN1.010]
MGELDKRLVPDPPQLWKFFPTTGFLAAWRIFAETEVLWSLPLLLAGVAALLIPFPPKSHIRDMDAWKIHNTEGDKKRALLAVAIPATVLAVDMSGITALVDASSQYSSIGFGLAYGVSISYGAYRASRLPFIRSKELVGELVEKAPLDKVTTEALDAIEQPGAQDLLRCLLAHGAIDGTRVMTRQVARMLDWTVEDVQNTAHGLEKEGVVSRSVIMAAGDPGKVYVEISMKGLATLKARATGR